MMRNRTWISLWSALAIFLGTGCSTPVVEQGSLHVIPQPQSVVESIDQAPFVIRKNTVITLDDSNEKMDRNAQFLAEAIEEATGIRPAIVHQTATSNCIRLGLCDTLSQAEGYHLQISKQQIALEGATEAGVFYGIQTLFKALPLTKGTERVAILPAGEVVDYPRFPYRGFLVDVGRHYFPLSYLKQLVDMMALHHINYFHWHLTEDQGWRIEIKKYPKLTTIGQHRDSTIINRATREFDGIPHEGFYTQEEARELVRYAAERYITIIPEIDMPGHMMAALASYPEMGCTGGPYTIPCEFGVFPDVLCAGNPQSLQFTKEVMEEILDIFPSPYIHIGGDECPKIRWENCQKCQHKIQELGIKADGKHTKEAQLQTWFMAEMEKFINDHGRQVMGWDEILEGGPTPNLTVFSWQDTIGGIEAARLHHPVIMTPIQYLYFSNPHWNKLQGINRSKRVYHFEPVPNSLTDEEKQYIIGAQGCIWTEWTADSLKMESQILPRMAALAEIQWTEPNKKDFEGFKERLPRLLNIYRQRGYDYDPNVDDKSIVEMPTDSLKKKSLKL